MRSFTVICWWALAIVFYTESVKSSLPNDTYPEHYNIELTTNVHLGEKTFKGQVTIDIVVVNTTSKIVLNAGNFEIYKASLENALTGESEDMSMYHSVFYGLIEVTRTSNEMFPPQSKWKLNFIYKGYMNYRNMYYQPNSFFTTNYIDDDGKYHYFAATNFMPSYARNAFPCYDEENKLANFTITINHSPTYTAISNMPVNAKLSRANRTVFLTTPPMPTYLVAFTVSDFEYTEDKHSNFSLRVYSRPYKKNLHEKILPIISHFVKNVSEYIDVPYMLPKMDIVIMPNYREPVMGTWGLIIFDEKDFKPDIINSDYGATFGTQLRIGREIACQWFSNYVSVSSFAYIWLTAAIETLYAFNALDNMYPEWDIWRTQEKIWYVQILRVDTDGLASLLPHYRNNENKTPLEIWNSFTTTISVKCLYVMRMWNHALTDKIYRKGLNKFLQKNQYGLVGEQELFNALQSAVEEENYEIPATITEMIGTWTSQKSYPILTVSRNYSDGTFTIKQETFYSDRGWKDSNTWYVPINYAVASNPNFSDTKATHYLRNVPETNFTDVKISNNDWIILNKQSVGYYRVNYDITNWNLIIKSLIENPFQISSRNRAQLLRDAIKLWDSNRLDAAVIFNLLTYLKKEEDFLCWTTFHRYFYDKIDNWKLKEKYDNIQFFFAELINPMYEKLRLVNKSNENYSQSQVRLRINSFVPYLDIKDILEDNFNNLKNHLKENKTLTVDVLNCNAMKMADDETFNTLYQMLIDKENKIPKDLLIGALVCHGNINMFKKLLRNSIDKSIYFEYSHRRSIITRCANNHLIYFDCIDFLNENFDAVNNLETSEEYYFSILEYVIYNLAVNMNNSFQEGPLLTLMNRLKNSTQVKSDFEKSIKHQISIFEHDNIKYNELLIWATEYREKKRTNSLRQLNCKSYL